MFEDALCANQTFVSPSLKHIFFYEVLSSLYDFKFDSEGLDEIFKFKM